MLVGGLHFTNAILEDIRQMADVEPSVSAREMSRRLCLRHGWRSPNGRLKDMSCRKALCELARRGVLRLPVRRDLSPFPLAAKPSAEPIEVPPLTGTLSDLGEVEVRPVTSRYARDSSTWRALLERYHYLGSGPLCGAQLRYLVFSSQHGVIGALAFTSASFALRAREEHIGWSVEARRANLEKVVCNARFLIAPTVQVPNLASHVLALALARLPEDWQARFGVRPVLVETFVDPTRFTGACYKAANFASIGESAGRRDGIRKLLFVRPLCRNWRRTLLKTPPFQPGTTLAPDAAANWAEEEFRRIRLFDPRLKRRLFILAEDFYANATESIPQACGSKARTIAAYRFFHNEAVTMDVVLEAHTEAAIDRLRSHRLVLAPQDTTTLDYSTHLMTEGLGPTNTRDGGLGLLLHDTLAFTEEGTPLGVLDAQCWARDPEDRGKKHRRHLLPIEEKESAKWLRSYRKLAEIQRQCPETTLVSIGDRESDVYELFEEAAKHPEGPHLLVRSEKSRKRRVDDERLWAHMSKRPVAGQLEIHIPRRGSQRARQARVDLRFARVSLSPPRRYSKQPPIRLWAVYLVEERRAVEVLDPEGDAVREAALAGEPIQWMLLTTAPVETVEDARARVAWYAARWGIEQYHRVLKSGCRIEDRQLGHANRLEACLGVDMVVAWRIFHLTMLGREAPALPCSVFFEPVEWKTLCCLARRRRVPPEEPPSLRDAVYLLGALGGHLGRRGDGPPGTQVLWRGIQRLEVGVWMAEMYGLYDEPSARAP
jgi:hypothetical protein